MEDLGLKFVNRDEISSQSVAVASVIPRVTLCTCCTKCLKCIKDWIPLDFKREMIQLVKLAGPVVSV